MRRWTRTCRPLRLPAALLLAGALALAGATALHAQMEAQSGGESEEDLLSGFENGLPGGGDEDNGGEEEDLLGGFEDGLPGGAAGDGADAPPAEPAWWALDGFVRLDSSYNYAHDEPEPGETDWRGLSKLRTTVRLELSVDLARNWETFLSGQAFHDAVYAMRGREEYTEDVLAANEDEAEVREAWLLGTPVPSLDVKLGRQIVVWGKADNVRVVDVLNPVNNREPGLTDLEDLRLPVAMSRLDYYFGPWALQGVAIHEIRFNKEPQPGSDFYPSEIDPPEKKPLSGGPNTEYGTSLTGVFSGWDLGLYYAEVFNDEAHLVNTAAPGSMEPELERRHARLTMAGAATAVVLGSWVLKAEAARFEGLEFLNVPDEEFARLDGMLGAEYSGFTDTTLAVEAVDRLILDHDERLEAPPDNQRKDTNQYVFSYTGDFLRQQLQVRAVLFYFGQVLERGSLQRYQATYELAPALALTGGVAAYEPGQKDNFLIDAARDNDRIFADLKWSF